MRKGKYLILGLFPVAIAAGWLHGSSRETTDTPPAAPAIGTPAIPGAMGSLSNALGGLIPGANPGNLSDDPGLDVIGHFSYLNADPKELIGVLEQLTGKTALLEQKLPTTKISIEVQEPLSRYEAIKAIESVLSLNGVAVIDMGEKFFKAVTSKAAISQSPEILDEPLADFEATQRICSKFFKLRYYDANEFQKLLKPILTPSSSNVIVFGTSNSLFITDTMANLKRVENLIQRTDTPISMVEEIRFIPMNNVKASAVVKKIEQLKRGALKKYLTNTTIDSDDSSNQLIVITPKENFPLLENVVKQLDNKCEHLLRSEVVRIKHGEAKKIAEIVTNIIKEQRQRIEKENKMAFERQQVQLSAQGSLANALAQAASGSRSNQQISNSYSDFISTQQVPGELQEEQTAQFSANLTLASDERSNSIIVYGTSSDLAQVGKLIERLDVLLDQVRIEVIVAQVTYSQGQQSGLESFGIQHALELPDGIKLPNSKKIGNHEITIPGIKFGGGSGSSFSGTLRDFSMNAIFQKAKTNSNVKILSNPTLVTTHNRKAEFKIGKEQPFIESSVQGDSKDAKERINVVYKAVGIDVEVTPLIGSNGIIQLDIKQEISKSEENFKMGAFEVPVVAKKTIDSFISVASGDIIVLAGFKEREEKKGSDKLFLLGDLPLLGDWLFSPKNRNETVSELVLFIKPTIVLRPQDENDYLRKRIAGAIYEPDIEQFQKDGNFSKPEKFPPTTLGWIEGRNPSAPKPGEQKKRCSRGYYRTAPVLKIESFPDADVDLPKNSEEDNTLATQEQYSNKAEASAPTSVKRGKTSTKTKTKKSVHKKAKKVTKAKKYKGKQVSEKTTRKNRRLNKKHKTSLDAVSAPLKSNSSKESSKKQQKKVSRRRTR